MENFAVRDVRLREASTTTAAVDRLTSLANKVTLFPNSKSLNELTMRQPNLCIKGNCSTSVFSINLYVPHNLFYLHLCLVAQNWMPIR